MSGRSGRTVNDLRRSNRATVLQRLYFDGPMSRQALGPATGLSSGTISNVVGELLGDGLVEEAGSIESDGGRPRTLVRVVPGSGCLIGVDVGETRVRVELFDFTLTELARTERPLNGVGYDVGVIVEHVHHAMEEVLHVTGVGLDGLIGVGVGVPGIVATTPEGGAVVHGQTIGWDAVPLESLLRASCRLPDTVPFFIENGARTLGQAEMWFGAGRGAQSVAVILFGSGVGACHVTDTAEQGRALEWGHVTVNVGGRRCRCGALGCLEAYAGAEALVDRWREAGGQPPEGADEETALTALLSAAYPDGGEGADRGGGDGVHRGAVPGGGDGAYRHGGHESVPDGGEGADPVALAVVEETAEYLGAGLSGLINLFQPERILVGGWAGLQLGPRFLAAVREHATSYSLRYPAGRVTIELGHLGPDAVTVGAATLPLAGFLAGGGRPAEPVREAVPPAWRSALEGRVSS
ncbi:ROK family transcriptional regulator [Streptomyces sp. Tu 2975]|uniref:ROK family transcriptional regulator n=1 Tax=Streptomyces sp. Tu 2975 TaxID=2676871 RepID=UPI00135A1811|nr:ROK family transcriptional regulator [Streptomyces sp. Tu 2975]QIP83118.1 ROK family transcriptional regulator [Streptomyces sp. Tu 2975]